jgi:hypothetical protein
MMARGSLWQVTTINDKEQSFKGDSNEETLGHRQVRVSTYRNLTSNDPKSLPCVAMGLEFKDKLLVNHPSFGLAFDKFALNCIFQA